MDLCFKTVIIVATFLQMISVSLAAEGLAVYYELKNNNHACTKIPIEGDMVAGVSNALWDGGRACGKSYTVRCIGPANRSPQNCKPGAGPITVKVVDFCRDPCHGTINLSQQAFERIAYPRAGKVKIEYNEV